MIDSTTRERNERIVVYASTRDQYDKMETAAKSLLLNNLIDKVYFLTEDDPYPNYLPPSIETINVVPIIENYFYKDGPNFKSDWSYMTLLRLAIYDMLPQHNTVLYLDTDTLVIRDISELFDIDLTDYYYAGVIDEDIGCVDMHVLKAHDTESPYRLLVRTPYLFGEYYNAGSMLCNLKALRDGKGREIIRMINTEPLQFKDQDAINISCRGKILKLPSDYNSAPMTAGTTNPKILHLTKVKNDYTQSLWNSYGAMSWQWIEKQMDINRRREDEVIE